MPNNYKAIIAAIAIALFVIVAGFFMVARSLENSTDGTVSQSVKIAPKATQSETPLASGSGEKLPEPTGQVDDAVDAIISGADNEKSQAVSDDSDAKSAIDNGDDTTNLNNVYDQNAL